MQEEFLIKEKRQLKYMWEQCLKELFEEAEKDRKIEVIFSALNLQHRAEVQFSDNFKNCIPSICNAMRSAREDNDEVIKDTKSHNSSTYTIKYILPRKNSENRNTDLSEKYFQAFESIFNKSDYQRKCIKKCEEKYRIDEASRLFYKFVISYPDEKKTTTEFIKYVYAMLKLWNMDQKGAKLSELSEFIKTIKNNTKEIKQLSKCILSKLDDKSIKILKELFNNLKLVKTKSPLVTFAKTLHFFLPNLIVPIDRKYTCDFFNIHPNQNKGREQEEQLNIFINLHRAFGKFTQKYDLSCIIDKKSDWNLNIPKIIDNMLIGRKIK